MTKSTLKKGMWLLVAFVTTIISVSCSKEEIKEALEGKKTEVSVYLKDTDGTPLNGWVVYGFSEFAWKEGSTFHAKQSATENEGKAIFLLDDLDIKDQQEVYRFVVYYTKSKKNIFGQEITKESLKKVVPVTLKQGENKAVEIKLD
ncbi:Conserved hypothetical protein [Capnocytophaga canimorsus Cc5]|uniref:Uncharacterized protein n=1 Tax=Capnocytophaga canimorsus (strain 5) TaxID=860228 RepID=F9YV77_CAPCC|nr:hypothetical protein [Capnocytophaga canimorsus]AEK23122.1 Conserved hypothetical protein [Capnocytophaga canimorsus Cc5]